METRGELSLTAVTMTVPLLPQLIPAGWLSAYPSPSRRWVNAIRSAKVTRSAATQRRAVASTWVDVRRAAPCRASCNARSADRRSRPPHPGLGSRGHRSLPDEEGRACHHHQGEGGERQGGFQNNRHAVPHCVRRTMSPMAFTVTDAGSSLRAPCGGAKSNSPAVMFGAMFQFLS